MTDSIIRVENLGKKYILGHQPQGVSKYSTLRDTLTNAGKSLWQSFRPPQAQQKSQQEEFWALQDVSFEVKQGECVGIIGRNGAGKSTLLKILSRITEPTRGKIEIGGRVASLLEVGTGFHPELTGRENIYLNGAVLGMTRQEIRRKFAEIVEFAEVERFLDTPVKRYSSGMYVRLAFAVAAHLEPEILVIDEVLAVGDIRFQKKCLGKMGEVASQEGRTILFVSHNMTAVQSLCSKSIWLNSGNLLSFDETSVTISKYLNSSVAMVYEHIWEDIDTAPGNEKVKWRRVAIYPDSESAEITVATPLIAEFECWNYQENTHLNFSLHLFSFEGVRVLHTFSYPEILPVGLIKGSCYIPANFLNDETYRINIMVVEELMRVTHLLEDALIFQVNDIPREVDWYNKWEGLVRPKFNWSVQLGGSMN
jgi:lipopolysaccharide transport system ATP-binding protein